ncbi:MAG: hypothetical protein IPJ80_00005 [Saprospiraceae bacterium]|nr:hypothetical protein [Saprospiraceae bacterium]
MISILSIILAVNVILTSMLLGIYTRKPNRQQSFALLRHIMDIPLFNNAEYTQLIKGNGLNPLLQKLLDDHSSSYFVSWFALNHYPICICTQWIMQKDF